MTILTPIPEGLQTKYLRETESTVLPSIRREGKNAVFPAFVRAETRRDPNGENEQTMYHYFDVPVLYAGQDLNNYDGFAKRSYADIRRFFYGSTDAQNEMRDDELWEAHRSAVRTAFPKP